LAVDGAVLSVAEWYDDPVDTGALLAYPATPLASLN
jgi:hypothetical protein